MVNGPEAVEALERWEDSHGKSSEILNERPVITLSLGWLWSAFLELSASRAYSSGGANRIQHSEILSYCVFQEIEGKERRDLLYCMRMMDNVWIEWAQRKTDGDTT